MQKKELITILKKIIKETFIIFYLILLAGLIGSGISLGIMTLIPDEASKACYLGYYAHCSFTPFSILILFSMGIIGIKILTNLIKSLRKKYKTLKKLIIC